MCECVNFQNKIYILAVNFKYAYKQFWWGTVSPHSSQKYYMYYKPLGVANS